MDAPRSAVEREDEEALARGAVVELQRLLAALELYAGPIDGAPSPATAAAIQTLRHQLDAHGADAPPLRRARDRAEVVRAERHAEAAAAAEAAALCYEEIAAARRADVEAARAARTPRPTSLLAEEVGASLLAAARGRLDAAARWLRAAAVDDARATRLARAREAEARAGESARAAVPWFQAAADGHAAAGDRLQASRALDGAAKAAALAADAYLAEET